MAYTAVRTLRDWHRVNRKARRYSRIQVATCPNCFGLRATHPPKGFLCNGMPASDWRVYSLMRRLPMEAKRLVWQRGYNAVRGYLTR